MKTKTAWIITIVFAFISVLSFFQVDSAWSDTHHFNTWWIIIGIIAGIVAIGAFIQVVKDWGGGGGGMVR